MVVHHSSTITSVFLISADGELRLQLLSMPGSKLDYQSYGHLGMRTEDIHESLRFHESLGCVSQALIEQTHQFNYFIIDPDGYETEIVQPKY